MFFLKIAIAIAILYAGYQILNPDGLRLLRKHLIDEFFNFSDRVSRDEYAYTMGAIAVAAITLALASVALFKIPVLLIATVPFLIPIYGLVARRLHDLDFSGWWQVINIVWLIVLFIEGKEDVNRFGGLEAPDPAIKLKQGERPEVHYQHEMDKVTASAATITPRLF